MTDTIQAASQDSQAGTAESAESATARRRRTRTVLLLGGMVTVAGGIPLAVALGVLHSPRWYPLLDLAQTELRVRDVGSSHPPLVGLAGRIEVEVNGVFEKGSHPGPLSFYALWPFYMLFGATAWALQAAAAALSLLAITTATWIAYRRGGIHLALGIATALALLARAYSAAWLTEAWNPYMPMLWWVVFLLAVWSILCHDLVLLPVMVFAGSLCMQTHVPYVGLVVGMGVLAFAAILWWFVPLRNESSARRPLFYWGAPSLALLTLLWVPPIYEQLTRPRGNFWMIYENFSNPREDTAGFGTAIEVWLGNLNPWVLLDRHSAGSNVAAIAGWSIPGLLMLAVWAGAALYAWRQQRHGSSGYQVVSRLHLVVAVALVLGLVSIARILGMVWFYLVHWSWGTTVLAIVATLWTAVLAWRDRVAEEPQREQLGRWATLGLAGVLVLTGASFTYDAAHTERPAARESRTLSLAAPQAIEALRSGEVVGGGKDGRYLVHWEDALSLGSQGYGFLLELERHGFEVGVPAFHSTGAVPHRVMAPNEATAVVTYVIGQAGIDRWESNPAAERIAFVEPRSDAERERYAEMREDVIDRLEEEGLDELVPGVDSNLFVVGIDERTPPDVTSKIQQMMDLGLPTAVYVVPPGVG